MPNGVQVSIGHGPTLASLLRHLKVGTAFVIAPIKLLNLGYALLIGRLAPRIQNIPLHTGPLYSHLACVAMPCIGARIVIFQ